MCVLLLCVPHSVLPGMGRPGVQHTMWWCRSQCHIWRTRAHNGHRCTYTLHALLSSWQDCDLLLFMVGLSCVTFADWVCLMSGMGGMGSGRRTQVQQGAAKCNVKQYHLKFVRQASIAYICLRRRAVVDPSLDPSTVLQSSLTTGSTTNAKGLLLTQLRLSLATLEPSMITAHDHVLLQTYAIVSDSYPRPACSGTWATKCTRPEWFHGLVRPVKSSACQSSPRLWTATTTCPSAAARE
jgi:hypothetical protein